MGIMLDNDGRLHAKRAYQHCRRVAVPPRDIPGHEKSGKRVLHLFATLTNYKPPPAV